MKSIKPRFIETKEFDKLIPYLRKQSAKEKHVSGMPPHWMMFFYWGRKPQYPARAIVAASILDADDVKNWKEFHKLIGDNHAEAPKSIKNGKQIRFLDPFGGYGTIPLEASRLRLKTHASDLLPITVFIEKCILEYPNYGYDITGKTKAYEDRVIIMLDEALELGFVKNLKNGRLKPTLETVKFEGYDKVSVPRLLYNTARAAKNLIYKFQNDEELRDMFGDALAYIDLWMLRVDDHFTLIVYNPWLVRKSGRIALYFPYKTGERKIDFLVVDFNKELGEKKLEAKIKDDKIIIEGIKRIESEKIKKLLKLRDPARGYKYAEWDEKTCKLTIRIPTRNIDTRSGWFIDLVTGEKIEGDRNNPHYKELIRKFFDGLDDEVNFEHAYPRPVVRIVKDDEFGITFIEATKEDEEKLKETYKMIKKYVVDEVDVEIPSYDKRNIMLPTYNIDRWYKLFTQRQLVVHKKIVEYIREVAKEDKFVASYLTVMMLKHVDYNTLSDSWDATIPKVRNTYGNRGISFSFTPIEQTPYSTLTGSLQSNYNTLINGLDYLINAHMTSNGVVVERKNVFDVTRKYDIIVTDPPYADDIAYTELSEFYYVWARAALKDVYPDLFKYEVQWKYFAKEEMSDNAGRWKEEGEKTKQEVRQYFETVREFIKSGVDVMVYEVENDPIGRLLLEMGVFEEKDGKITIHKNWKSRLKRVEAEVGERAISRQKFYEMFSKTMRKFDEVLADDGIITIYFAHMSDEVWTTLIRSIRDTSLIVTKVFSLPTENKNSVVSRGKNSIYESVVLVLRRAGKVEELELGELLKHIDKKLDEYADYLDPSKHTQAEIVQFLRTLVYEEITRARKIIHSDEEVPIEKVIEIATSRAVKKFMERTYGNVPSEYYPIVYLSMVSSDLRDITSDNVATVKRDFPGTNIDEYFVGKKNKKLYIFAMKDELENMSSVTETDDIRKVVSFLAYKFQSAELVNSYTASWKTTTKIKVRDLARALMIAVKNELDRRNREKQKKLGVDEIEKWYRGLKAVVEGIV